MKLNWLENLIITEFLILCVSIKHFLQFCNTVIRDMSSNIALIEKKFDVLAALYKFWVFLKDNACMGIFRHNYF